VNSLAAQGISTPRLPRAKRRTWTLGGLDRRQVYRLHFNELDSRWDIDVIDQAAEDGSR
jgi:hypothetical protein